jgi:hypothetical protein
MVKCMDCKFVGAASIIGSVQSTMTESETHQFLILRYCAGLHSTMVIDPFLERKCRGFRRKEENTQVKEKK